MIFLSFSLFSSHTNTLPARNFSRNSLQYESHKSSISILNNIFQQQSMLKKPIGTIQNTKRLSSHAQQPPTPQSRPNQSLGSSKKRAGRANSVGKIYSRKSSLAKENMMSQRATIHTYDKLINYSEIENKLSKYLQCSINTAQRPRYNYLNQHYNQLHQHPKYTTNYEYHARELKQTTPHQYQSNYTPLQTKHSHQNIIRFQQSNIIAKWESNPISPLKMSRKKERQYERRPERFSQKKQERRSQRKEQKLCSRQSSPREHRKTQQSSQKQDQSTQKKIQKRIQKRIQNKDAFSKKLQFCISNKQNFIPLSNTFSNRKQTFPLSNKKQNLYNITSINHQEHKNQLQLKLNKIINNYQNKNKELSMEMHKIEEKGILMKNQEKKQGNVAGGDIVKEDKDAPFREDSFKQAIDQLIQYNLKCICLPKECDPKLQEIWRSFHKQIIADQNLRIAKCFINQNNINHLMTFINDNRIKKIEISALKTHSEEYDPFLLEKLNQILKISAPDFTHKVVIKWISEIFVKYYEESQRNWIKNLSQQKIECFIKNMFLERQINGLRKNEGSSKELNVRDFTRYMSIIFKANLRNRNIYQMQTRLRGMGYMGRFIELLQQKAGKGACLKKAIELPK